jgi:hypothetical protein
MTALFILVSGCKDTDSGTTPTTGTGAGLFKSAGTFSFNSNRGNFSAQGIFDTMFTNTSASGAFKYTERGQTVVMVFAYNIVSPTNVQFAFAGVVDTIGTTSTGTYSFSTGTGSKIAFFGYIPNAADTSSAAAFYIMANGSMVITALTETNVTGTFSGTGTNESVPTQTITVTNGSCNTPIVDHYFSFDGGNTTMTQEKIKTIIRKQLQLK